MAKITLWGMLNNYKDIMEDIKIPDIDKETLLASIIIKAGENEVMYPNPAFMKVAVKAWFRAKFYEFNTLFKSTTLEYNPIENYDRKEEWEDVTNSSGKGISSVDSVSENFKNAYDSASYKPQEKNDGSVNSSGTMSSESTLKRKGRAHGNIGVTTSQQMLESEREVAKFDIYEYISDKFEDAFTITVY